MVLPSPPADASPAEPHWLDQVVVAIELSAQGVLTLVDNAAPARLREAYLRLRARDPATEVTVDARRIAELPPGATVVLALTPLISTDDLDWLNLNRPVISDLRLNVVLWCERDAAAFLARRAPDFFDWISVRVDCPPAPAAFAVADVQAAIRSRAPGIAWAGPGLEDTLAAVRPGRPIRRVAVASYQSMIDALTSRARGWLFLEGIDSAFHLRRLRWAMAETGRRTIVLRRAIDQTLPGWWTLHAEHVGVVDAVHEIVAAGGTGRLAALTGLDPDALAAATFLLHEPTEPARLETLLSTAADPRRALSDRARPMGWIPAEAVQPIVWDHLGAVVQRPLPWMSTAIAIALSTESMRRQRDDDPVISGLRAHPRDADAWILLGTAAIEAGDFEVAVRWLTAALGALPDTEDSRLQSMVLTRRGVAYRGAGDLASARADLEQSQASARRANDASLIALATAALSAVLVSQGEPQLARGQLESVLHLEPTLDPQDAAALHSALATALIAQGELARARAHLECALSLRRRVFGTDEHREVANALRELGAVLIAQNNADAARSYLESALEIMTRREGPDHPALADPLRLLALADWAAGRWHTAGAYLDRALTIQQRSLEPNHPDIATTLATLGRMLADTGQLKVAQAALQDAVAIRARGIASHRDLEAVEIRKELAKVLVRQGDVAGAIAQLEQALTTLRISLERDDNPQIVPVLRELERLSALQRDLQRTD